jgi:hypothetical protein
MKLLALILALAISLFAEYKVGDKMQPFVVKDQFDKDIAINDSVSIIVLATNKESGKVGHSFFEAKPQSFFTANKLVYMSDMSSVPTPILNMFMMDKFKKYSYKLAILKDGKIADMMPEQDGKLSVIKLNAMQIKEIQYAKTKEELQTLIQ